MDHHEALRRGVVEKYLLGELASPEREEFEAHFFECGECAEDLRSTAAFLDSAKRELTSAPSSPLKSPKVDEKSGAASWFAFLWKPAFVSPAFALLLVITAYQNAVLYPRLSADIARLKKAEVLEPVSLIGATGRGGPPSGANVASTESLLLSFDIPATPAYRRYAGVLVAPSGAIVGEVRLSADEAHDTVALRFPASDWRDGEYRLIVRGLGDSAGEAPADLAQYRFTLHVSN